MKKKWKSENEKKEIFFEKQMKNEKKMNFFEKKNENILKKKMKIFFFFFKKAWKKNTGHFSARSTHGVSGPNDQIPML